MITDGQISFIQSLLKTSSIDCQRVQMIERELYELTEEEGYEMINGLKDLQLDPINYGSRYTQTDIKNKLKYI